MAYIGNDPNAQGIIESLYRVGQTLSTAAIGLQEKVDTASSRLAESMNNAAHASNRHATQLVRATWALVIATAILALTTGALVWVEFSAKAH